MSKCGEPCEIFSRVTGYHRPLKNWNDGKQAEYKNRKSFRVNINNMEVKRIRTKIIV